jgi:hypothetical protein
MISNKNIIPQGYPLPADLTATVIAGSFIPRLRPLGQFIRRRHSPSLRFGVKNKKPWSV